MPVASLLIDKLHEYWVDKTQFMLKNDGNNADLSWSKSWLKSDGKFHQRVISNGTSNEMNIAVSTDTT